jgi:hypothetical protein
MSNVKAQSSNEVQSSNDRLGDKLGKRKDLLSITSFGIPLTFEI